MIWNVTNTLLLATIVVSVIAMLFIGKTNLGTLRQGKLPITQSLYHLIIAFVLLEIAVLMNVTILLAVLAGWIENSDKAEHLYDAALSVGLIFRLFVIYYAYRVYQFLSGKRANK